MTMNRRSFLTGLIAAPVVITTPGLLMPLRGALLNINPFTIEPPHFKTAALMWKEGGIPFKRVFIINDKNQWIDIGEKRFHFISTGGQND